MLYPVIGSSIKFNLIVVPKIFIAARPTAVGSVGSPSEGYPLLTRFSEGRPISCPKLEKVSFRSWWAHFLEVVHGSGHGFSDAGGSVCNLVLQLRARS